MKRPRAPRAPAALEMMEPRLLLSGDIAISLDDLDLPDLLMPGSTGKAYISVGNDGDERLPAKFNVSVYASLDESFDDGDVLLGSVSCNTKLRPDAGKDLKAKLTFPASIGAGQYYILAVADPTNAIDEADETNNVSDNGEALDLQLPTVDLVAQIGDGTQLGDEALQGDKVTAYLDVTNEGNVTATGKGTVQFFASLDDQVGGGDDVLLGSASISKLNIAPGVEKTYKVTLTIPNALPEDSYYLIGMVTGATRPAEADPTNNARVSEDTFDVVARDVDLDGYVGDWQIGPTTRDFAAPGDSGTVQVFVGNNGNVRTSGTVTVAVYASVSGQADGDAIFLGQKAGRINLNPGDKRAFTVSDKLPSTMDEDQYRLIAVVDSTSAFDESDETNNLLDGGSLPVAIPGVDLTASLGDVTLPDSVIPGTAGTVDVSIANEGNLDLAGSFNVTVYASLDGTLDGTAGTDYFALGSLTTSLQTDEDGWQSADVTVNFAFPTTIPVDGYFLVVAADSDHKIAELDETNNLAVSYGAIQLDEA